MKPTPTQQVPIFKTFLEKREGKRKVQESRIDLRGPIVKKRVRVRERKTFGNGVLDFGAFGDDVVVIDAFLLFDEVVVVAIFASGVGRSVSDSGKFDLGDEKPLEEGKGDSNNGANRNENLGSEIWENHCSHG